MKDEKYNRTAAKTLYKEGRHAKEFIYKKLLIVRKVFPRFSDCL